MVGKAVPNVDAIAKATGEAVYTTDINLPGMLIGKILRSPIPHAKILRIDTSRAKRIPGVKAVITADDTPKVKFGMGAFADKLALEDKKVRCIGDEIAAVAAIDEDIANEALKIITVDFEKLPAVYDPIEAMREDAPRIHENFHDNISMLSDFGCGNVDTGFNEADIIIEDEFRTAPQSHCCMEVHNIVAKWESTGKVSVWASTQSPYALKNRLAKVCNMSPSQIRVIKPHVGGAFGSKANMIPMDPIAVFLAKESNRPVKIENSREEEFFTVAPSPPTITNLKFGFKKDGRITAKQARVIMGNGAYNLTGPAILTYYCTMFSGLYRCTNIKFQGYLVYTNKLPTGSFRGFGTPQAMFGHEIIMDIAAEKLGMDPKDIRLINANLPNEMTADKVPITSCGLTETILRATEKSSWIEKRKTKVEGRGIGMACMMHTGASSNIFGANYSGATIKLDIDGSITLSTGATEIGQGSNTILLQIAAEVLGLSIADIRLVQGDTDITDPDVGARGSRTTFCAGNAVNEAAEKVRNKILNVAAQMLETELDELTIEKKTVFARHSPDRRVSFSEIALFSLFNLNQPITGNGFFYQEIKDPDLKMGYGYESPAMVFGTQIAEVEVDKETGLVKVKFITSAHDLGRVINPMLAESQVEGGVVQGLGSALLENIVFDGGRFVNTNFTDYKLFTSMDVPKINSLWIETNDSNGPFGSKGIGEAVTIPTAPAVANAIYDAIGVRFKDLPVTPEKILKIIKNNKVL
ncbi:MAG: xanthine dehydrogenase family protein molybdopterin-binding subunit [Candidatus Hodarchaeota archaeon]